jgi:type VI secretion system protein ImpA
LDLLDQLCQTKFGDDAPGFRVLRLAVEDVHHAVRMLASPKRENEPPLQVETETEAEIEEPVPETTARASFVAAYGQAAAAAPARISKSVTAEPVDGNDALRRIIAAAAYLRREDPYSAVPYLVTRAIRWGELRANGDGVNADLLEAPPTETRQQLKKFMSEGEWEKVLEAAESAMALPCGRGWLDLQRYVLKSCAELGSSYDAVAGAIRSELRSLLKDLPQLPDMTLLDDTATANAETRMWLAELFPPDPPPAPPAVDEPEVVEEEEPVVMAAEPEYENGEAHPVDAYEVALDEARNGNLEAALQTLVHQISQEGSGRGRFTRRMQLAQICVLSNRHAVAYPLLQDLAREIEERHLEDWEGPETIAKTLALLLQSMQKLRLADEEKKKVYSQICRLDPIQAMRLAD